MCCKQKAALDQHGYKSLLTNGSLFTQWSELILVEFHTQASPDTGQKISRAFQLAYVESLGSVLRISSRLKRVRQTLRGFAALKADNPESTTTRLFDMGPKQILTVPVEFLV